MEDNDFDKKLNHHIVIKDIEVMTMKIPLKKPIKMSGLTISFAENLLTFTVSDQGEGFDFSDLPDPTLPENLEKPQGRGIFLMNHLADGVVFEDPGNTVEISFKL